MPICSQGTLGVPTRHAGVPIAGTLLSAGCREGNWHNSPQSKSSSEALSWVPSCWKRLALSHEELVLPLGDPQPWPTALPSTAQHCPAAPTLTWVIRTSANACLAPTSLPHTVPRQRQAGASASPGWAGSQQGRMPMLGSRTWLPASLARAEHWGRCDYGHMMPTRPPRSNGHRAPTGAPACPATVSPISWHAPTSWPLSGPLRRVAHACQPYGHGGGWVEVLVSR